MIYTVTLNPSIDFIVRLDTLLLGSVNRMTSDDKYVSGKGINVSRIFLGFAPKVHQLRQCTQLPLRWQLGHQTATQGYASFSFYL
ncbi:1-phosphofructokinase [Streptococcus agalactiae 515]|nr:1-phosphofructokinase [Streptococcus agalactiae 515]